MDNAASRRMFLMAAACLLATPLSAQETPDMTGAQSAIKGQLEAFLADDAKGAYAYAAPNIKRLFPTVERFMSMVEQGYQPVRRPSSYSFGQSIPMAGDTVLQEVLLVDGDGKGWKAIYRMQRQPDGTWKIAGVSLKAADLPTA
ncbi:DUF4864 domain-containing protein [Zhengella mangrovi]|nr:DUF4864 domain-containing protein [Zhengella mangrovi]